MKKAKIYGIIPGEPVYENSVMDNIFALIGSVSFDEWIELNEHIYNCNFFSKYGEFYVMYLDSAGVIKRLYITKCSEIVSFMKKYINYGHGDGADIAICTKCSYM